MCNLSSILDVCKVIVVITLAHNQDVSCELVLPVLCPNYVRCGSACPDDSWCTVSSYLLALLQILSRASCLSTSSPLSVYLSLSLWIPIENLSKIGHRLQNTGCSKAYTIIVLVIFFTLFPTILSEHCRLSRGDALQRHLFAKQEISLLKDSGLVNFISFRNRNQLSSPRLEVANLIIVSMVYHSTIQDTYLTCRFKTPEEWCYIKYLSKTTEFLNLCHEEFRP